MEEQIMVFSKEWFKKHNKTLCWFANAPIIKYWFRWLLRIHNDVSWDTKINQITPNSFTYNGKIVGDKVELTTDFRTHEKFGKRLYYGLKPFWYLLHFWDWSTSVQPALNCGFDTLTVYPDAGTGNTTVDGFITNLNFSGSLFSDLVSGSGTTAYPSNDIGNVSYIASYADIDKWVGISRAIFLFDTSSLTSSATISSAVMSIFGNNKADNLGITPNVDIYTSSPAANNDLQASDYSQIGTTSQTGSPISYSSWNVSSYNDFTFNSTGIGNISKDGVSKFGTRNANYDVANNTPSWTASLNCYLQARFADYAGTSNDPKLVVTYALPSAFIPRTMWFN